MKIALFKGEGLFSRLIKWQTRSPYSHAAIIDENGALWESREGFGVRVTTNAADAINCSVDLFDVEMTDAQRHSVAEFLRGQLGKKYDWTMVLRFISRRQASRSQSEKWFCSELVFAAFKKAGIDLLGRTEPWECSPGLLARSPLLRFVQSL